MEKGEEDIKYNKSLPTTRYQGGLISKFNDRIEKSQKYNKKMGKILEKVNKNFGKKALADIVENINTKHGYSRDLETALKQNKKPLLLGKSHYPIGRNIAIYALFGLAGGLAAQDPTQTSVDNFDAVMQPNNKKYKNKVGITTSIDRRLL